MTELIEVALKQAGLTAAKEEIGLWIDSTAHARNTTAAEVEEIFIRKLSGTPKPGHMSQESYIRFLFASTATDISTEEIVHITPTGIFPTKPMKDIVSCDMLCTAKIRNKPSQVTIIAKGADVQKLYTLDLGKTYSTRVGLRNVREGVYKAWLGEGMIFTVVETTSQIKPQYPVVHLSDAASNLSRYEPNSTIYTDVSDLKIVPCATVVTKAIDDTSARLGIVDETFIPTNELRLVTAWVNPHILRMAGVSEKACVNLLGTLGLDDNGKPCMHVCAIIPIVKRPLGSDIVTDIGNGRILNISM